MKSKFRRELRVHRILSGASLLALVVFAAAAFQRPASAHLGEINVERINVVEKDGRTKIVISNSERQTPGAMNGHPFPDRPRPAGLIFFNDEGDEDGGLVYEGLNGNASASLTFDQYKQDQTVELMYGEGKGQRQAGLFVRDRSAVPLDVYIEKHRAALQLPDGPARATALDAIGAVDNGLPRVFVGKDQGRASVVMLADEHGRPRLRLKVEANGTPSIEMLDEAGNVMSRMPTATGR